MERAVAEQGAADGGCVIVLETGTTNPGSTRHRRCVSGRHRSICARLINRNGGDAGFEVPTDLL